ncbi:hypothetical protein WHR41_01330 [Cladosporium halotolerans]|uniref:DUF1308 domain-containing protein n=1 Tax=Cladosporium halotolerans TaxID=1052096 RepID=A0AB34KYQ7_9PEZI
MAQDATPEDAGPELSSILGDLTKRAQTLLAELEVFKEHLRSIRLEATIEMAHFRGTVQSELNMLERLAQKEDANSASHIVRSSNLPFLETVWNSAKSSKNLTALQKRMYYDPSGPDADDTSTKKAIQNGRQRGKQRRLKAASTIVDAVADGGLSWTKVSLVTNTRLLFDLAKQGWECGASSDEDEDFPDDRSDDDRDVPILKTAKELASASRAMRIRTRHPKVTLVLPRIIPGVQGEIDKVLDDCRVAGVEVWCSADMPEAPAIRDAQSIMVPDPFSGFTDTLNIDCTILLAIVSEFSHAKVSKEPWFHKALKRQVEIEDNENLLPSLLYPAMGDRGLVCTQEACKRMREIVDTIGTASERARTTILMGDDDSKSREELVQEMQTWSAYEVPSTWQLPIRVVDQDENNCQRNLPGEAAHVIREQTDINRSVFLHGWAADRTTITSNRSVVKQLESELEQYIDLADAVWPKIWLCPTARSLVGREKRGAKKEDRKEGVWPMPDPLRREEQRRNGLDVLSIREGHEVEDLRPQGYATELAEVIAAKEASKRERFSP